MKKLELAGGLREQILREAEGALPRECCGLVEGVWEGETARAMSLYPAHNLSPRADRFEIASQDLFDALRRARAAGRAVIGCYHSHPGGKPEPSAADLAGAGEEGFVWLIAARNVLAAFVYSDGGFVEVLLTTGPARSSP